MGLGPTQGYLAQYNSYVLPGYVQDESMDSSMSIANHPVPYGDGSLSEYTGLENKQLTLTLKVWEQDYISCKKQVSNAATMLRSKRNGFAPLYVQYTDRYYEAMTKVVKMDKTAGTAVRILDYQVEFECRPWLVSTVQHSITAFGPTTLDTDAESRTIEDGGWTPTRIEVTGTNITISGYTSTGEFAGFISVSGFVNALQIDAEEFTATRNNGSERVNANDHMLWADYQMFVGPGKTTFAFTGTTTATILYNDRWYL